LKFKKILKQKILEKKLFTNHGSQKNKNHKIMMEEEEKKLKKLNFSLSNVINGRIESFLNCFVFA
jgi:hypothetical protein